MRAVAAVNLSPDPQKEMLLYIVILLSSLKEANFDIKAPFQLTRTRGQIREPLPHTKTPFVVAACVWQSHEPRCFSHHEANSFKRTKNQGELGLGAKKRPRYQ